MKADFARKIPKKGYLLAYFRSALLFEPYVVNGGDICFDGEEQFARETPFECHFFDAACDYHIVHRQSRGDVIEGMSCREEEEQMDPDLVYVQDVLVREEYAKKPGFPERLRIVTRYRYSEMDTLVMDSYRIGCMETPDLKDRDEGIEGGNRE